MRSTHSELDAIRTTACPRCFVCHSDGQYIYEDLHDPYFGAPGSWALKQCQNPACALLWLDPKPVSEDLWKAYKAYHTHSYSPSKETFGVRLLRGAIRLIVLPVNLLDGLAYQRKRLRYMFLDQVGPGSLLEIGFGRGRFLNRMRKAGWDVEGIDSDPEAALRVMNKYRLHVHARELTEMRYDSNRFDAIAMSHSIEHLYDPSAILEECHRILKPGGLVAITTPNAQSFAHRLYGRYWRGLEPPRHLHVFSPGALSTLVDHLGFELVMSSTLSCNSAGIHYASEALCARSKNRFRSMNAVWSVVRSFQHQQEEYRECRRGVRSGQDLLTIARKPFR